MSYYTRVHINRDDLETASTDGIIDAVGYYIQNVGWSEDLLADLRESLDGSDCDGALVNKLWCPEIEDMMLYISRAFPTVGFGARGFGEEFRDIWIREFRDGKVTFAHGPFDEE